MIKPATPAAPQTPKQRVLDLIAPIYSLLQAFVLEPSEGCDVKSLTFSRPEYPLQAFDYVITANCGWESYKLAWRVEPVMPDITKLQVRFIKTYLDQPGTQTEDFVYDYMLRSDAVLGREDDAIVEKACSEFLLKHIVPKYAVAVAQT